MKTMRICSVSLALGFVMISIGCAGPNSLQKNIPANVSYSSEGDNNYVTKFDFSYQSHALPEFSKLKMCVAENVNNNPITLTDAVGSHFTRSGLYSEKSNHQTINDGELFKYIDGGNRSFIASGTTEVGLVALGTTKLFAKYDLEMGESKDHMKMIFRNILTAQQDTGTLSNDGFTKLGAWRGSRLPMVYKKLNEIADNIKNCAAN